MDTGPAFYEIRVAGHLAPRWVTWLGQLALQHDADGNTRLSGHLPDQAALHGILNRLQALGLTLVSLNRLASHESPLVANVPDGVGQSDPATHST